MRGRFAVFTCCVIASLGLAPPAQARITKIVLEASPIFTGSDFGSVGPFEKLVGVAFGEVDPNDPRDATIQDIGLAPRNERGMVEYSTDVFVIKPVDMSKGNGMLFYNVHNRGNKGGLNTFNLGTRGGNDPTDAGDGFLQKMGYTIVWSGWQPDVLPGNGRLTAVVPVATNPDGTGITGIVRSELKLGPGATASTTTLNLGSGHFTGLTHASYEPVSLDNRTPLADGFLPTLTQRRHVNDPRVPIANSEWSFQPCVHVPPGGWVSCPISYPAGFQPGVLYELVYRAKNPTVLALGWAGQRDLMSFFKHEARDDAGNPNPLLIPGKTALAVFEGSSQSGRSMRTFIHLGFNEDEQGRIVFEGAFPHIGGGRLPMNVRFSAPGRAWGYTVDHLYPAYEFPFSYMPSHDPITRQTGGLLERCLKTNTCPRIMHVATALEIWEGRQSLGFTDPLGKRDLGEPGFIRTFIMASTQHGTAAFTTPDGPAFGDCEQQQNPNPQAETMRALWVAFTQWVKDGVEPPPSSKPRVNDRTFVPPAEVRFPSIPGNAYPNERPAGPGAPTARPPVRWQHVATPLHVLDFGPRFDGVDESGVIEIEPPREGTEGYGILVPQVDADGNDVAGVRSVTLQVPLATYTGWNMGASGRFEDGLCSLSGTYVPFAPTDAERVPGDGRQSIRARYGDHAGYVAAVQAAAARLVAQRLLLPEDAKRLIAEADAGGVLR
jgi:alpha/beta hydrolase family protein